MFQGISYIKLRPKLNKGGILKRDYITYSICKRPLGVEVERRFADFQWLRAQLDKEFPLNYIPPLGTSMVYPSSDYNLILAETKQLQWFLDKICIIPRLHESLSFKKFVGISDLKKFKESQNKIDPILQKELSYVNLVLMQNFNNNIKQSLLKNGITIEDFKTFDGSMEARVCPEMDHYTVQLQEFLENLIPNSKK